MLKSPAAQFLPARAAPKTIVTAQPMSKTRWPEARRQEKNWNLIAILTPIPLRLKSTAQNMSRIC
jgi:hypothetical protein